MSKGPGKIQRKLLALIDSDSDGARSTRQLSDHVYGAIEITEAMLADGHPSNRRAREKRLRMPTARRVAIVRALHSMQLPAGWRYEQTTGQRNHYLVNTESPASCKRAGRYYS